jgi:predicted outer membrane repeat protein
MRRTNLWQHLFRLALAPRGTAARQLRRRSSPRRLSLELLEDRNLPSSYTAATVSDLIADINAANAGGGANTITLAAGTTFVLSAVDNTTDGATGLPVIAANDNLTVAGNGDTLTRSTATGTPAFRLFDVAGGGSLTLNNLTLQGGLASSVGGAIANQGTLLLTGVTVQNNVAQNDSAPVGGGGIYSSGSLTLTGCTIQNNQALAGAVRDGYSAYGGGLYVEGGTASLTNVTLSGNTAQGGNGADGFQNPEARRHPFPPGDGGDGLGGGMYVAAGTVTLRQTTVSGNAAIGGTRGQPVQGASPAKDGVGEGGGLYLASGASVYLDSFTMNNVTNNSASTSHPNIYGSFKTIT